MGIFDGGSEEDEVKISPGEEEEVSEGRLKDEVETEIVGNKDKSGSKTSGSERGRKIREKSTSGKKSVSSSGVSLEDVHRQNERIIELLEDLANTKSSGQDEEEFSGDLNGVL